MYRIFLFVVVIVLVLAAPCEIQAQDLPAITNVAAQPFIAATERLVEALDFVGAPLSQPDDARIKAAMANDDSQAAIREIQEVLDPYCLAGVNINAESRVKVAEGPAEKILVEQGWRTFLVKVHNEAGINPVLKADSPQALPASTGTTTCL